MIIIPTRTPPLRYYLWSPPVSSYVPVYIITSIYLTLFPVAASTVRKLSASAVWCRFCRELLRLSSSVSEDGYRFLTFSETSQVNWSVESNNRGWLDVWGISLAIIVCSVRNIYADTRWKWYRCVFGLTHGKFR